MITQETAQAFAKHWIDGWNSHDLAKILDHYTDDFEMTSPYIVEIANDPSGTLKGKDNVAAYWSKALAKYPELKFEMIEVLWSVASITIYYRSVVKDKNVAELFLINESGKAYKAIAHYN